MLIRYLTDLTTRALPSSNSPLPCNLFHLFSWQSDLDPSPPGFNPKAAPPESKQDPSSTLNLNTSSVPHLFIALWSRPEQEPLRHHFHFSALIPPQNNNQPTWFRDPGTTPALYNYSIPDAIFS